MVQDKQNKEFKSTEKQGFEIIQGSALDILKQMPDESVQCCITSPPYYGLRSYGTEPLVWDGDKDCNHLWGASIPYAKQDNRSLEEKIAQEASVGSNRQFNSANTAATSGNFCQSCGAWCGELGLEPTLHLYITHLIQIFTEVRRVLKDDGVCFVNLGDSYAGSNNGSNDHRENGSSIQSDSRRYNKHKPGRSNVRPKSLMQVPARFAIRMTDELGFVLRNEIIWHKPSCMPYSGKDRFTVDFEPVFFFAKNPKYKFNQILEPAVKGAAGSKFNTGKTAQHQLGRSSDKPRKDSKTKNKRTTWSIAFEPQKNDHYAAYPTRLVTIPILSGTDEGDTVLDPFNGTGTTGVTALQFGRKYIGIEMNEKDVKTTKERLERFTRMLF